jgi:hypothetical protein
VLDEIENESEVNQQLVKDEGDVSVGATTFMAENVSE